MITIEQVLAFGPCNYDEARLLEISGGRRKMTALEIAKLASVPITDRIWLLARPEIVGKRALAEWACDCVEHVLPIWESWAREHLPEHLGTPRVAIETKRRHLREEATAEELSAAWSAAKAADRAASAAAEVAWAASAEVEQAMWPG